MLHGNPNVIFLIGIYNETTRKNGQRKLTLSRISTEMTTHVPVSSLGTSAMFLSQLAAPERVGWHRLPPGKQLIFHTQFGTSETIAEDNMGLMG